MGREDNEDRIARGTGEGRVIKGRSPAAPANDSYPEKVGDMLPDSEFRLG